MKYIDVVCVNRHEANVHLKKSDPFKRHFPVNENDILNHEIKCEHCNLTFSNEHDKEGHECSVDDDTDRKYKEDQVDDTKQLVNTNSENKSMFSNRDIKACKYCGKTFEKMISLYMLDKYSSAKSNVCILNRMIGIKFRLVSLKTLYPIFQSERYRRGRNRRWLSN